jgi:hypothetical protein
MKRPGEVAENRDLLFIAINNSPLVIPKPRDLQFLSVAEFSRSH